MSDTGPVLLSGFEPFDGAACNPSQVLVEALDGTRLEGGVTLRAVVLPVAFERAAARLVEAVARHRPRLVLALGHAPRRRLIGLERVALNLCDAPIPDNDGVQPVDGPVVPGAPAACFATLPLRAMHDVLREAGLPVELSLSAGSYVCNEVFFRLLHGHPGLAAGFMHLPDLEQVPAELQQQAVRLALTVALVTPPGGRAAALHRQGSTVD